MISPQTRRHGGILLVVLPTVIYDGASLLYRLNYDPRHVQNHLRQDLWRAGHTHAGVLLLLSLVTLLYLDDATLSARAKTFVRITVSMSAILLPAAFFFSGLAPDATKPNDMIYLAYLGTVVLAAGLVVLRVGLFRKNTESQT
jgi:hypothetical protein